MVQCVTCWVSKSTPVVVATLVVVVRLVMNALVEVVLVLVIFLDLLEKVISQFLSSQGDAQLTRT